MKLRLQQPGRKATTMPNGFSAIEMLITLFIAAAFLVTGYQLYNIALKDGGQTRDQAKANNIADEYLERYKYTATNPCTAQVPLSNSPLDVTGLSNVTISVGISCPYTANTNVSKVLVTVSYGRGTDSNIIKTATYVTK